MSSLCSVSSVDEFEFVEAEQLEKPTIEETFIRQYKQHQSIMNSLHQDRNIFQQVALVATPHLRSYLLRLRELQKVQFQEAGDWILAETRHSDSRDNLKQLRILRRARQLFSDSASLELLTELDKLIEDVDGEERNLKQDIDMYSAEQHLFDLTIIKKSIRLLRNILSTTTAEKFVKLQSNESKSIRTHLFGLLDHLKRWFQHLLQRFQWFLELRYVKFPACCASTKLETVLQQLPTVSRDLNALMDEFLANFKLAFGFCERYEERDIIYYFYEALVHICLRNETLFEQLLWTKSATNPDVLNERLSLMEHHANLLEKMITDDPLRLVQETADPEAAYCSYIWLKCDLCLQHFRCLFDAHRRGFKINIGEEKKWLSWATNEDLKLEQIPLIDGKEKREITTVETWILENTRKQVKDLETLVDEISQLGHSQLESEMGEINLSAN